jgi:hypothetical protein
LASLPLLVGGLLAVLPACTSQTAIVIIIPDAGTPGPDSSGPMADAADVAVDRLTLRDAVAPGDLGVPGDVATGSDLIGLGDVVTGADLVGPADLATPADVVVPADVRADVVVLADARADLVVPADVVGPADLAGPGDVVPPADRPGDAASVDAPARDGAPGATDALDSPPSAATLFKDGFEGGFEVNWLLSDSADGPVSNAKDGANPIVTLDSTATDFSRLRCNLSGDKFSTVDITASMRVRIDEAPSSTRTVRLDVRQDDVTENIFYAVGASVSVEGAITRVAIFKKVPDGLGNYTICELASGPRLATPIAMGEWRTIKLKVSGTSTVQLTAFFEDLQVATYTDDCSSKLTATDDTTVANGGCLADQTALGIQVEKGLKASVDDVLVTAP